VHLNDAYVERAKQLEADMETALIDVLYDVRPMSAEAELDQPADTPASAKVAMPE
jgi:hypothetical protein